MGADLLRWMSEGRLDPMIALRIMLEEVPETLGRLRRREFDGKAVVTIRGQ